MANFQYLAPSGAIVEAIQFKAEDQDLTRAWSKWFIDLLIDGRIERNMHEKKWYLDRTRMIQDQEWVIKTPNGDVYVLPDDKFKERYQEVTRIG